MYKYKFEKGCECCKVDRKYKCFSEIRKVFGISPNKVVESVQSVIFDEYNGGIEPLFVRLGNGVIGGNN